MKKDLLEIIKNYGVLPQLKYFQSEVFELNEAIMKYQFAKEENEESALFGEEIKWNLPKLKEYIAEELADVTVMLKQFQAYYKITDEEINEVMRFKIARQKERMKNENN